MRCFLAVKPQIFKNFTLEQEIGGVAGVAQEILMRTVITAVYLRLKFCGAKLLNNNCVSITPAEGVAQDREAGWRAGEGVPLLKE